MSTRAGVRSTHGCTGWSDKYSQVHGWGETTHEYTGWGETTHEYTGWGEADSTAHEYPHELITLIITAQHEDTLNLAMNLAQSPTISTSPLIHTRP
jgi:hypothetical protein